MIRVRVTAELEIDPDAWCAAAREEEWIQPDEVDPADYAQIAEMATSYIAPTDKLPRWARDTMRVTSESVEVIS